MAVSLKMSPHSALANAPWRVSPATRAVIEALEAKRAGATRFVGGCVRNTLMDVPVDDIDLATQLRPEAVIRALERAGLRAIPTGLDHGTVTAISEGHPYEITTLRRDVATDGRRAVVAFTEDWAEDAARRDFRLNALYAGPDGTLYDPTGGGRGDAEARRVIFIGDGDIRLREDYLRILRFFRFNAWYGTGIDGEGLAACARQKAGLSQIAAERIWKELKKLLAARDPLSVVEAMEESGVWAVLAGERAQLATLKTLRHRETRHQVRPDPMRRFGALLGPAVSGEAAGRRFRLSRVEIARLTAWREVSEKPPDLSEPRAVRRALYTFGADALIDQVLTDQASSSADPFRAVRSVMETWALPSLPIKGQDLIELGFQPGPELGETLHDLERRWVDSDFSLSASDLIGLARDLAQKNGSNRQAP